MVLGFLGGQFFSKGQYGLVSRVAPLGACCWPALELAGSTVVCPDRTWTGCGTATLPWADGRSQSLFDSPCSKHVRFPNRQLALLAWQTCQVNRW